MNKEDRIEVMNIMKSHGYNEFTGDNRVVRVAGVGIFGERIAVHPARGCYTLYVRRGGEHNLRDVCSKAQGGVLDDAVLSYQCLSLETLDEKLKELRAALIDCPISDLIG